MFHGITRKLQDSRRNPQAVGSRLAASAVMATIVLTLALWVRLGPVPAELLDDRTITSTSVVDRRGLPLYEALSGDGTRNVALTADAIPGPLMSATIAAEDRRFWLHPGIDPIAMLRALKRDLLELRVVE